MQRNTVERPRKNYCGGNATIHPACVDVTVNYIKIVFLTMLLGRIYVAGNNKRTYVFM